MLMAINSVCGCAAGNARPGLAIALERADNKPDHLVTGFAGQDKEATQRAREYFSDYPRSSPSCAFLVDAELNALIARLRAEGRTKEQVAQDLLTVFDAFVKKEGE